MNTSFELFDIYSLKTPCYVTDEGLLRKNLETLKYVRERTGCKILLAQKAFSMYETYPLIAEYLDGTTASGLHEAMLGREYMGNREVHVYSPAYRPEEMDKLTAICDHMVFNSCAQWRKFREKVQSCGRDIKCGIRINPEYSEIETDIYNPCFTGSRLGTTLENFDETALDGISGLHFHTMCEQNSDTLERTVHAAEEKFGKYFSRMEWLNFGGGHHITRPDYDVYRLIKVVDYVQQKYGVQMYLEPGEAVALNAGFLVAEVLDTMKNGMDIAIIDASAACHMPDVLEMPYRPNIIGSGKAGEKPYTYRLGSATCLAGDIIGDYSFDEPLKAGDRLVFCDMAIYSMCKNNTFNGINLPDIYFNTQNGMKHLKAFGYEDFKSRL
ncbi:MAG: carboxynorspermidine decarboxylase [Oscillospiraceae bacterium]|nr:carboxynorspermidine decarboxylase [Oscillospiraceae bacterium]